MKVVATEGYVRRVRRLLTPEERSLAEAGIIARPEAWPVIAGTGGARKARIAFGGRGKRGGGRVIYFYSRSPELVALIDIYAKSAKEDLTHADKKDIRAAIQEIRAAFGTYGTR